MYSLNIPGGRLLGTTNDFLGPQSHFRNYKKFPKPTKERPVAYQEILANSQVVIKPATTGTPEDTKVYNYEDIQASYSTECKKNNSTIYTPAVVESKKFDDKWFYVGMAFILILVFMRG